MSQIDALVDSILKDPDATVDLSSAEVVKIQKKSDLYGVVVPAEETWANISIVNMRDTYNRKLITTALVGYLFRVQSEYTRAEHTEVECPSGIAEVFGVNLSEMTKSQREKYDEAYRVAVKNEINNFLCYNFEYNPDRHVDTCYKDNVDDPERAGKFSEMRARMEVPNDATTEAMNEREEKRREASTTTTEELPQAAPGDVRKLPESRLNSIVESLRGKLSSEDFSELQTAVNEVNDRNGIAFTASRTIANVGTNINKVLDRFITDNPMVDTEFSAALLAVMQLLDSQTNLSPPMQFALETLRNYFSKEDSTECIDANDLRVIIARDINVLREQSDALYPYVLESVRGCYTWVPPVDVYHHFDRYLSNHYELFREAVQILYCEKPDIDFAIQYYDRSFSSEEEAKKSRMKIQDRVTAAVYTISNGTWNLLGPFKQNRERVEFYNKKTEVIKRMLEQVESDHRLGEDLMKKRVKREKHKNIIDAGPDDPNLAKYKDAISTLDTLGAKEVLTDEDRKKMAEAKLRKEMTEVPPDAIQVDMHRPVTDPVTGETTLVRDKFYTKAEAPTFMEDRLEEERQIQTAISEGKDPQHAIAKLRSTSVADESAESNIAINETINEQPPPSASSRRVASKSGKIVSLEELKRQVSPDA